MSGVVLKQHLIQADSLLFGDWLKEKKTQKQILTEEWRQYQIDDACQISEKWRV